MHDNLMQVDEPVQEIHDQSYLRNLDRVSNIQKQADSLIKLTKNEEIKKDSKIAELLIQNYETIKGLEITLGQEKDWHWKLYVMGHSNHNIYTNIALHYHSIKKRADALFDILERNEIEI